MQQNDYVLYCLRAGVVNGADLRSAGACLLLSSNLSVSIFFCFFVAAH